MLSFLKFHLKYLEEIYLHIQVQYSSVAPLVFLKQFLSNEIR